MVKDIVQLTEASGRHNRAWEWDGECTPEVERVARHGKPVAPLLANLLDHGTGWSVDKNICYDQQLQLVLCKIFNEMPRLGINIYGVRVREKDNLNAKAYWEQKMRSIYGATIKGRSTHQD